MSRSTKCDASATAALRIRHPRECHPRRPERTPAWAPGRDRRDVGRGRLPDPPVRRSPKLTAAPNLGAVRLNFRYASFQSMAAAHSEKAGRDQYFEGPHETYGFRLHEIDPRTLDLQYQPATLSWTTSAGVVRSMTFDWAVETDHHRIAFGEDKSSQDYFDEPELAERLDFAETFLASKGASLVRRTAGGLPSELRRRIVKDVFDARRTEFAEAVPERVRRSIEAVGGTARLGDVLATIGHHPARSLDVARALMHRRVLSMPLASPPMPDTPVTLPSPAAKGALRAFLAAHLPLPAEDA